MSGRPYARNPRAPFAGPRDLEAVLPHTFRLEAPVRLRDAKHEAIRSAIRRRCMQKNWRKMISIRHRRLASESAALKAAAESKSEETEPPKPQEQEKTQAEDAVETASRQLQQLQEKLQTLTEQKHAKFQLLKDILVEEARSKMASAPATTGKKRRVEFKDLSMTPSPAKMQVKACVRVCPPLRAVCCSGESCCRLAAELVAVMLRRHRVGDDSGAEQEQDVKVDGNDAKSVELSLAAPTSPRPTTPDPRSSAADPIHRDEKIKRIARNPVPFGSLVEALGYSVFLILFILATTVVEENMQAFYFANRLKTALVDQSFTVPTVTTTSSTATITTVSDSSSLPTSFTAIRDQAQMWAFLQGPFADVVYGTAEETSDDTSATTSSEAGSVVSSSNLLLGGVQLRTLRVKAGSCPSLSQIPEYETIVPFCYGKFDSSVEEKQGYGLILNSADIVASISYATARLFFTDLETSGVTKAYTHLQTCYSDCERVCGEEFGVDKFRYTSQCTAQCAVQCTCIYEEPVGIKLCADPNPDGEGKAIPAAVHAYNWSSAEITEAQAVRGYTDVSFPGSGYVVDLGLNGTRSRERLAELKVDRYLDLPTRALIVDFTVYNAYLQLFNIVEIVVEFPASGGAFVQLSDAVLRLFRYSSASTGRITLEGFLVFYILIQWWRMLKGMYRNSAKGYLTASPWNILTALHLVAFAVTIAIRLYTIDLAYGTMSGEASKAITSATLEEIPNLQGLATVLYAESVIESINAALVWLKLLQYTTVSKRMSLLLRMLGRAARDLAWFFVCFLVCICAFAQIGLLLFGLDVRGFSSLGSAIVTLLQAVAGELDYAGMADSHRVAGPIFYILYYLLLLLILVNVFLAILNDAYMQTITEQEEEDEELETAAHNHVMGWDESGDVVDANADISPSEERALQAARREMEQLRKYPFSKGLTPAFRLFVADVKRVVSEIRNRNNGVNLTKVDPLIMLPPKTGSQWPPPGETASRKLTRHVKRQVASELLEAEDRLRVSRRVELQQSQIENLRHTVDEDVAARLEALAESNRLKTQRMRDLEKTLGSIEKLCQQLVSDTACLRVDSDEEEGASHRGKAKVVQWLEAQPLRSNPGEPTEGRNTQRRRDRGDHPVAQIIHPLTKTARALLASPFWEERELEKRRNVLLLGDSRGDVHMADGLDADEIIRVGFLNVHVDEALDENLELYDVVFTHDTSLVPVQMLIEQVTAADKKKQ
ncbi:hypothetical protein PF008_g17802 [Phytophthora fragariae]|uniref:5'-nucleotidase n=1 Tax=Phytophthora fragariae TaxID=53985 RepID=A0A6G0R7K6_9STRA|nr:hypothetical protein PF008_g17802 [Phytophthora fragariae]